MLYKSLDSCRRPFPPLRRLFPRRHIASPGLHRLSLASTRPDSLSELKRKFKDVLRAYWRQHKIHHEGEDTDQYDVAFRIATNIFNLYWDKPNYAGLKGDKKEILNYFIKHIQLSKSREGQLANLPSGPARGSSLLTSICLTVSCLPCTPTSSFPSSFRCLRSQDRFRKPLWCYLSPPWLQNPVLSQR